jgi:hypothetical protein
MNFRVAPEIYNITSAFDYAQDQAMVLALLDADPTNANSLADPLTVYNGWFAATNNETYKDLTETQMSALGTYFSMQMNDNQGLGTIQTKSMD